jgi:hypothetical protein
MIIETAIVMGVKTLLAHGAVAAHSALAGQAAVSGGTTILGGHMALAGNVASLAPQGASTLAQAFSNLTPSTVSAIGHAVIGAAASHAAVASTLPGVQTVGSVSNAVIGAAASHAAVASTLPGVQTVGSVSNALMGADSIELLGLLGMITVAKHPRQLVAEAIRLLSQGDADMAKELLKQALKKSRPLKPFLKVDNWT